MGVSACWFGIWREGSGWAAGIAESVHGGGWHAAHQWVTGYATRMRGFFAKLSA